MPSNSIPGYVARYGDALKRLSGGQPSLGAMGTVAASRVYDPNLSPSTGALGQEAAAGVSGAFGNPMQAPTALPQQVGQADVQGALGPPPAPAKAGAPSSGGSTGRSFWDIAKSLTGPEKDNIADSFEKKGVDVQQAFRKLQSDGKVDPGLIKRGPDGKIDRGDMGVFLLEAGLRNMQGIGKGESGLAAAAGAQLDTMDARRARAASADATTEGQYRFDAERSDKAADRQQRSDEAAAGRESAEKLAGTREAGDNKRTAAEIEARGKIAAMEAVSRKEAAEMASGANKRTFVDEDDGMVYWVDSGEPVMVKGGGGLKHLKGKTQQDRGVVTDKDVLTATEKHRAVLDGDVTARVTIPGEAQAVRWKTATDSQKKQYLDSYASELKGRAGKQTPEAAGGNVFDQFDSQ